LAGSGVGRRTGFKTPGPPGAEISMAVITALPTFN
jgi:hypothetical protein